jgi:hypothetical protein
MEYTDRKCIIREYTDLEWTVRMYIDLDRGLENTDREVQPCSMLTGSPPMRSTQPKTDLEYSDRQHDGVKYTDSRQDAHEHGFNLQEVLYTIMDNTKERTGTGNARIAITRA